MSKSFFFIAASLVFFLNFSYAQEKSFSTIEKALEHHIVELKSNIDRYDNIFVMITLDSSVILSEGALKVNCAMDAKLLKKGERDFIVQFVLSSIKGALEVKAINFRLLKRSRKKIEWINLGNGRNYSIK